jgi:hypothetical protein
VSTDSRARAPLPLLLGFGAFVAALVYLVAASLGRREAPVFTPTPLARARANDWERVGDTLTLDATDGARWRYASLARGHALAPPDTAGWELAARRYRITVAGALADLGPVPFEGARVDGTTRFVPSRPGEEANAAIGHWYRYGFVTHLLEPDGRVFALRTRDGALWKLQVVGYYCPRLVAGCLTLRYAPMAAPAYP